MLATTTWNDVAMVLTIGTFVMVWVLVMLTVGIKLRRQAQAAPVTPQPPRFLTGLRLHIFIAVMLIVLLSIAAPLAWVVFGQAGMPVVRLGTIGILLAALYAV